MRLLLTRGEDRRETWVGAGAQGLETESATPVNEWYARRRSPSSSPRPSELAGRALRAALAEDLDVKEQVGSARDVPSAPGRPLRRRSVTELRRDVDERALALAHLEDAVRPCAAEQLARFAVRVRAGASGSRPCWAHSQPWMRFLPGVKLKGLPSPLCSLRVDQPDGVSEPSAASIDSVTIAS